MSWSDMKVYVTHIIDPLNFYARIGNGMLRHKIYCPVVALICFLCSYFQEVYSRFRWIYLFCCIVVNCKEFAIHTQ